MKREGMDAAVFGLDGFTFPPPHNANLMINLKTANALGLKIPQPLLLRADRVIE